MGDAGGITLNNTLPCPGCKQHRVFLQKESKLEIFAHIMWNSSKWGYKDLIQKIIPKMPKNCTEISFAFFCILVPLLIGIVTKVARHLRDCVPESC